MAGVTTRAPFLSPKVLQSTKSATRGYTLVG